MFHVVSSLVGHKIRGKHQSLGHSSGMHDRHLHCGLLYCLRPWTFAAGRQLRWTGRRHVLGSALCHWDPNEVYQSVLKGILEVARTVGIVQ